MWGGGLPQPANGLEQTYSTAASEGGSERVVTSAANLRISKRSQQGCAPAVAGAGTSVPAYATFNPFQAVLAGDAANRSSLFGVDVPDFSGLQVKVDADPGAGGNLSPACHQGGHGSGCSSPTQDTQRTDLRHVLARLDSDERVEDGMEDNLTQSCDDGGDYGLGLARGSVTDSAGGHRAGGAGRGRKKLGRPASFNEDEIDWDKLTPDERRKIRRRLSNRASAHRVRQRRMEMMGSLQVKIQILQQQHTTMLARLAQSDARNKAFCQELALTKERCASLQQENLRLQQEVAVLHSQQVRDSKGASPEPQHAGGMMAASTAQGSAMPHHLQQPHHVQQHQHVSLSASMEALACGGTLNGDGEGVPGGMLPSSGNMQQQIEMQQQMAPQSHHQLQVSLPMQQQQHDGASPRDGTSPLGTMQPPQSSCFPTSMPPSNFANAEAYASAAATQFGCGQPMDPQHAQQQQQQQPFGAPAGGSGLPLNLDRAGTMSFGLGDLENAPSLGFGALSDLGFVGGLV